MLPNSKLDKLSGGEALPAEAPIANQLRELLDLPPGLFRPFRMRLRSGRCVNVEQWSDCIAGDSTVGIWIQQVFDMSDIAAIEPVE